MQLAVLADIHGNLTALNAVLNDIKGLNVDKFIIAGDHIIDCPQNNEVLEKIRSLDAYVIQGNREKYIMEYHNELHDEWKEYKQMSAIVWTYNNLCADNLKYISKLPEQLSISLPKMDSIRVVHGSPFDISEKILPHEHAEKIEGFLNAIEESVLICGHTHEAWNKVVNNKLILNPGSVGVPFNENGFAEYAVLTWKEEHWTATHHQVEYNINQLKQLFFLSGLYENCETWCKLTLQSIKEGKDINMEFLKYAYDLAKKNGYSNSKLIPDCIWEKADEHWFKK
ncbi:MAG: metallophosphoesterase family protein [Bacillota bacterium]|nr:metallophosphoesterase family protein [Bacillota bacterium]